MPPEAIFDHTTLDLNKVVISQEGESPAFRNGTLGWDFAD